MIGDDTVIHVTDYHTAGEPFRIVTGGVTPLEGRTVLDKRDFAAEHLDDVRALLVNEPRGHADMYGCFVTEPDDSDGHLGVVFFHKDGFSTACGHGTIALVTWALQSGIVACGMLASDASRSEPTLPETVGPDLRRTRARVIPASNLVGSGVEVIVDAPSGRLSTIASIVDSRVDGVRFWNVPAFVTSLDSKVETSVGTIAVDIAFGGAFYASVAIDDFDLEVSPASLDTLIALAREVKAAFRGSTETTHRVDKRLSGLYGVIFHETVDDGPLHQRNVTVFADGEVDRSPCGSGTSARLAILDARGGIRAGGELLHEGIVGTTFSGRVEGTSSEGVLTSVGGTAHRTGVATFTLDPTDPLGLGFQLR